MNILLSQCKPFDCSDNFQRLLQQSQTMHWNWLCRQLYNPKQFLLRGCRGHQRKQNRESLCTRHIAAEKQKFKTFLTVSETICNCIANRDNL